MFLQGKKKTPYDPTKGFWFVSADIPLKALCFPLKCRALGHEDPHPWGIVDMEPLNYCTTLPHMFGTSNQRYKNYFLFFPEKKQKDT